MVAQEFQAVVLAAGRGTRLPEVLGENPKCLLPIGPYPLLWYPLNILQQHNFQEAIVVVLESEKLEVQQTMENIGTLRMKLDFVAIPSDADFGTADSLRYIHDKIKSDFLVLSCDIVTNVSLYPLISKFRQNRASVAALLFKSGFESGVTLPGPKTKQKPERDLIGIHPESQRLLFLAAISDFEEVMNVNAHLLRKNEKMTIFSRLVDSHIYVMRRWIIDFIKKKENFSTLKGELLPYIIKKQMSKKGLSSVVQDVQSDNGTSDRAEEDIINYVPQSNLDQQIDKTTLFNDSRVKDPYNGDLVRCYAIEAPKEAIGVRVNTTLSFYAMNQKLSSIWPQLCCGQEHPLVSPKAIVKCTQAKEIAAADNARLSEKTSLNFSVFGPNCLVNPKNIINKSLLMAGAKVEEGCNIENSIVGSRAVVKKGSVLKNCLIGPGFVVEEGSTKQMQHLTNADGFMEIDIQ